MNKLCKSIIILVSIITLCFSTYFFIDARYALSETVRLIEQRLDYKILEDRLDKTYDKIWKINDQYGGIEEKMAPYVKGEYRRLNAEKQRLQDRLKSLDEQQIK